MAKLSTHVLDTAHGRPAAGMAFRLYRCGHDGAARALIVEGRTNADGRNDAGPLLSGERIGTGVYELEFDAGDYFRALGLSLPEPAFVDRVLLRFGLADGAGHYHVPLLVSPWSYSTYRGS